MITGYCRWHPDADSSIGGKVAVVPVVLYEMKFETKELIPVVQTVSRKEDGFFGLPIPPNIKNYSIGVKIERAENCPPQFKHLQTKKKPKQKIHL